MTHRPLTVAHGMAKPRLVTIGKVTKPFGIRGEVKIFPYTETFEVFERSQHLTLDGDSLKVLALRIHKGTVLATFEGISSRDQAQELTGRLVRTSEENLPPIQEDEYYWYELIGMKVTTVENRELGAISNIIRTGANDVLCVDGPSGEILLPMIEDVIVEVDTENGAMLVDPLEGLVPDG